jgi:DNA-directed RNA polymerase subunit K/omega
MENADPLVPRERDKDTVVALREISAGLVNEENVDSFEAKNIDYGIAEGDKETTV